MTLRNDNPFNDLVQLVIAHGTDAMAQAFATLLNHAMLIEREQHLGVAAYGRSEQRRAYANGTKPKTLDTPAGRVVVDVPKTRGIPGQPHEPFFSQALVRGTRACRAVTAALAQMYVQGVSTRDVAAVMDELGLEKSPPPKSAEPRQNSTTTWRSGEAGP